MGDFYTAEDAIIARLRAGWTATPADRLRITPDTPFDQGEDLAAWAQLEVIGDREEAYPGTQPPRVRIDGLIMLHLLVPVGAATARADLKAMYRNARALLAHQHFAGVVVNGLSSHGGRPATEDGNYHGVTATAPFFYIG